MNPGKRLGQLEEVMAEMLQKQDRLETLAVKTFEIAENANAKVDALDAKINAKFDALDAKVDALDAKVDANFGILDSKIDGVDAKVDRVDAKVDTVARALANLTVENQLAHQQMNEENIVAHQQMNDKLDNIMSFLKEKFS